MRTLLLVSMLSLLALPRMAAAQDDGRVVIDITSAQKSLYPVAIPVGVASDSALAKEVAAILSFDLQVSSWFKVLNPKSFLANLAKEEMSIEPGPWKDVGAYGVVKSRVRRTGNSVKLDFALYEVEKGARPVLEKTYTGTPDQLRALTHQFANEVVKYFTGEDGFFGSELAFVMKNGRGRKQVMAMGFDGTSLRSLSRNRSINILPAWSPDGSRVAYTSYMRANPDLYIGKAGGGRPVRISRHPGMNTGATWSPDGQRLALTLSRDGQPEIYVISARTGRVLKRLTNNRFIDTSPAWSPDGREIAFVSNREGGPQIFVMNAEDGSNVRRVSLNGDYNTTPTWSPVKGQRVVAYTTRAENGRYDIVTLDLSTNKYTRITQGQGNNEEPSFSPNGRAIAFSSRRKGGSGIYIASADGTGRQYRVYKGAATEIDWGPLP